MNSWMLLTSAIVAFPKLQRVTVQVPDSMKTDPFNVDRQLVVPEDFAVEVVARVSGVRFLLPLPNKSVLVSLPYQGKVLRMDFTKDHLLTVFADNLRLPHGMALTPTGCRKEWWVFIAEELQVIRMLFNSVQGRTSSKETVVNIFPESLSVSSFLHPFKNIAIHNNILYISIASATNENPSDLQHNPILGAIYSVNATDGSNRRLVSQGIRNAEGLAFAPDTNQLWAVINQRDEVKYPYDDESKNYGKVIQQFVDNHPAEQFVPITEGSNFGWPFCFPVLQDDNRTMKYVADYDRNLNGSVMDCQHTVNQEGIGLPAHTAPLGLRFWTGDKVPLPFQNSALVCSHGSSTRTEIQGNKVLLFSWKNGQPQQLYELMSGWITDPVKQIRWGRPVDVGVLVDGSILISDDYSGSIYRLSRTKQIEKQSDRN